MATLMSAADAKNGEMQGFSSVPALDFALLDGQKGRFLAELRHILVNVGFLYLENPPIDKVRSGPRRRQLSSTADICITAPGSYRDSSTEFLGIRRCYSIFHKSRRTF